MKYCTNCGRPNEDGNRFCEGCGTPFDMLGEFPGADTYVVGRSTAKTPDSTQLLTPNAQPHGDETQLLTPNTQPQGDETQLLTPNTQPQGDETQLLTPNTQPQGDETQLLTPDSQPQEEATQPIPAGPSGQMPPTIGVFSINFTPMQPEEAPSIPQMDHLKRLPLPPSRKQLFSRKRKKRNPKRNGDG